VKLDNYTTSKIKDQIEEFLFIKWLKNDLKDCKDPEIKELYKLYYEIMSKQVNIVG